MPDRPNASQYEWRDTHASIYSDGSSATDSSEIHSVGSYGVKLVRFERGTNSNVDPACPELVLGLDLGGSPDVRWSWGDRWRVQSARSKGCFGLSPIGEPGYFEVEGRHRVLVVSFPLPKILGVFDDDSRQLRKDFGILHDRYRKDRLVSQLATHLWELSWTPSPASLLEADAATLFLLARLNTFAEEGAAPTVRVLERFTARQQKIVLEYIEANLAGTIRNGDLAGQVCMSVREFHGRFVATFGLAPHRFVMHRRVLKARFLIEGGKGLAETSFECGFADQSHLTRVFKNLLGILPGSLKP